MPFNYDTLDSYQIGLIYCSNRFMPSPRMDCLVEVVEKRTVTIWAEFGQWWCCLNKLDQLDKLEHKMDIIGYMRNLCCVFQRPQSRHFAYRHFVVCAIGRNFPAAA